MPVGSFTSKNPPPSANRTGPVESLLLTDLRPHHHHQPPGVLQCNSDSLTDPLKTVAVRQQPPMQQHQSGGCSKNNVSPCCVPTGCLADGIITPNDIHLDAVRITCSNKQCTRGSFMHKTCFDLWESNVVIKQLSLTGPARSWTDKQKQQNAWKKGYDLAYRACKCACNNGYLKKDTDWVPPSKVDESTGMDKKKRNRNRSRRNKNKSNGTIALATVVGSTVTSPSSSSGPGVVSCNLKRNDFTQGSRPPGFGLGHGKTSSTNNVVSHVNVRCRTFSISSTGSGGESGSSGGKDSPPISRADSTAFLNDNSDRKAMLDYVKDMSFPKIIIDSRHDYSTFQRLPKQKCNGYYIRVEDDNKRPDDDKIRKLILLTLRANGTNRMQCVICKTNLPIFGKFPMIDGTFFLSPKSYTRPSLTVESKSNANRFLHALCISCLVGWRHDLICVYCGQIWIGNRLILGSMYIYDIFAARDCCKTRLCCNKCKMIIVGNKPDLFGEYSHFYVCPHCGEKDNHFVKPLNETFVCCERHQMSMPRPLAINK